MAPKQEGLNFVRTLKFEFGSEMKKRYVDRGARSAMKEGERDVEGPILDPQTDACMHLVRQHVKTPFLINYRMKRIDDELSISDSLFTLDTGRPVI